MTTRFSSLARIPSFVPLSFATLMLGVAMSFTTPYLSLFSIEQAGMTPFQLGVFMTVIAASGVIASTWAGKWTDRHGHQREVLFAALVAAALGFLCLCFVRDYRLLLVIGVVFLGAGGSALSLVFTFGRAALVVKNEAERAFATATLRTVLSTAWVFGPSIGALLLAALGFYGLFIVAAASFAACAVIVSRINKTAPVQGRAPIGDDERDVTSQRPPHMAEAVPDLDQVSRRTIWRTVGALTLIGLAANATQIVLPLYIVHGLHGTRIDVSIMLGLGAFLEIPMLLVLGARGASLNKFRWLAACAAVHVVYFIAMAAVSHVPFLIPIQSLNAFVVAVIACLGLTYIQDLMPRAQGAATALFFNAARAGSILSGMLSGILVGALGYKGTFLCCAALVAVAFLLFANPPLEPAWRWFKRQFSRIRRRIGH